MSTLYVRAGDSYAEASADDVLERARELIAAPLNREAVVLRDRRTVQAFVMAQMKDGNDERRAVLLTDAQDRLMDYVEFDAATSHQTLKYPRSLIRIAIAKDAAKAILVHKRSSGRRPCEADDRADRRRLKAVLTSVEIPLAACVLIDERIDSVSEEET